MIRYVVVQARDGTWGVVKIGKPYRLVLKGLASEAEAQIKGKELAR